jgi:prohibitin 2
MKTWAFILMLVFTIPMAGCMGCTQVDEGWRGIETNWGKVVGDPLKPGLWFYNPFSSDIFEMDVRENKWEGETEAFTKDTQKVKVKFAVTIYPKQDKIGALYSQFGREWANKLIPPNVEGKMKDAIGRMIADELVQKRDEVRKSAQEEIASALAVYGVIVTSLNFTNLQFDNQYEQAVEAKVVAIQSAIQAKNKTVQVQEEARQRVMAAQADAEAMRIKSNALSQNKGLVQYEAVQKWNGQLPHIVLGNQGMILDLKALSSQQ